MYVKTKGDETLTIPPPTPPPPHTHTRKHPHVSANEKKTGVKEENSSINPYFINNYGGLMENYGDRKMGVYFSLQTLV